MTFSRRPESPDNQERREAFREAQKEAESPQWKRDWLPRALMEIDRSDNSPLHGRVGKVGEHLF